MQTLKPALAARMHFCALYCMMHAFRGSISYLASAVACMVWEGAWYGIVSCWLSAALLGSLALLHAWLLSPCW